MAQYVLENETLVLTINSLGAEMVSLKEKSSEQEYLWNGDEKYWKRSSPVLFPLVGNYKNKECIYKGKSYPLSQHGFARDMEFACISQKEEEIWFSLHETEETLQKYPFAFCLEIGYRLFKNQIQVLWKVKNTNKEKMYFSIGGHPAFLCPLKEGEEQTDYHILFDSEEALEYALLDENGLKAYEGLKLPLEQGAYRIPADMFDKDALIFEDYQVHRVSLLTPQKDPYVTLDFLAPVLGIWSPAGKHAPFVCIEPWYGRSDAKDFDGTLEDRQWGNELEPEEVFEAAYTITIE